jgi:hypothetical protein
MLQLGALGRNGRLVNAEKYANISDVFESTSPPRPPATEERLRGEAKIVFGQDDVIIALAVQASVSHVGSTIRVFISVQIIHQGKHNEDMLRQSESLKKANQQTTVRLCRPWCHLIIPLRHRQAHLKLLVNLTRE